jgi:hypothetical protein
MDTTDVTAEKIAEQLRRRHNGIMSVHLAMGHDGANQCFLRNYEGVIGQGESGRSLLEAVQRAESDWRRRRYWNHYTPTDIAAIAAEIHAGADHKSDGVFSTASFQSAIEQTSHDYRLTAEEAVTILRDEPRIVRLSGGCHWLVLPGQYARHIERDTRV